MEPKTEDAGENFATLQLPPLAATPIPDQAEGVNAIVKLTREASRIEIVSLGTEGLGEGLPATVPLKIDHRPNGSVQALVQEIERYRQRPARREGIAKVTTLASFIDLTNRHKSEHSALFANTRWPGPSLSAVINYHELKGVPAHLDHRVVYDFPITDELKAWIGGNGKLIEQREFAEFLEEHAAELASPFEAEVNDYERLFKEKFAAPNDLIALSRNLEVYVGAKVKRGERLQSGERTVEFVEEHTNSKGEKVEIPGIFMVAVPAFLDGAPVRIPARLRYRIVGGNIMWGYQLYRWEYWLRNQVQTDLLRAAKGTGLPPFEGEPEYSAR